MIIKTVKLLRNNWKKSAFLTGVLSYGGNYLNTSHKINKMMKEYCENASAFGDEKLSVFAQPKHLTVILNPRSKKSKCRKYFNDYVEPILHCAGYKVSVVETESQGQAVQLMEVMSNTDAVLVAGGSGTIHEVITGLLRREDANQYARSLPIGFLPLGANNRTFHKIYDDPSDGGRFEIAKLLADSAMKILKDNKIDLNVLRIHNSESNKTVFSLNKLEFGVLSELERRFPKYWYLGNNLAKYYVYLKATMFKKLSELELGRGLALHYTERCEGCSNCYREFRSQELDKAKQRSGGWFSMFRSANERRTDHLQLNIENRLKSRTNHECGRWKSVKIDKLMNVQIENCAKSEQPELKLKIFQNSTDQTKSKFYTYMKSYPHQEDDNEVNSLELRVKDLRFDISNLNDAQARDEHIDEQLINESSDKSTKLNYFIDDENYDVKNNLEISSKLKKMKIFY